MTYVTLDQLCQPGCIDKVGKKMTETETPLLHIICQTHQTCLLDKFRRGWLPKLFKESSKAVFVEQPLTNTVGLRTRKTLKVRLPASNFKVSGILDQTISKWRVDMCQTT